MDVSQAPGQQSLHRRRRPGPAIGIALAVVVVLTVVGWIVVPERLQGMVTALALVTAPALAAAVGMPRWPERIAPVLLLASLATGVALLFQSGSVRAYGFIAILVAITIAPAFAVTALPHLAAWAREQPTPPLARPRTVALGLASGALIAATALGFAGIGARVDGGYHVKHGQPVTVALGEECTRFTDQSDVTTTTCPNARWTVDGEAHRGTAHIGPGELDVEVDIGANPDTPYVFTNETLEAYVVAGDPNAYTAGFAARAIDGFDIFHGVPWWFLLGGPVLVVALIGGAIVRKVRHRPT